MLGLSVKTVYNAAGGWRRIHTEVGVLYSMEDVMACREAG